MRRYFDNPMIILLLGFMAYSSFKHGAFSNPGEWIMSEMMILPGIVIGLTFHEFAHALVADKLGDNTPRMQGRVSISPLDHVDPIGFIALIFVGFGWGKPVEINPYNFKNRRRDELLVSFAGVAMNFLLAVIFAVILKVYTSYTGAWPGMGNMSEIIADIIFYVIYINLVLMVFNLLPIPPLDGFNILTEIFDLRRYNWWYQIYNNGFVILMVLILFNFTDRVMTPILNFFWKIIQNIIF